MHFLYYVFTIWYVFSTYSTFQPKLAHFKWFTATCNSWPPRWTAHLVCVLNSKSMIGLSLLVFVKLSMRMYSCVNCIGLTKKVHLSFLKHLTEKPKLFGLPNIISCIKNLKYLFILLKLYILLIAMFIINNLYLFVFLYFKVMKVLLHYFNS